MKIAFILTQDLESPSGIGRYWPLASELTRLGHEIEIIALHPHIESLAKRNFREKEVSIHYVAPMHVKKIDSEKNYYPHHKLVKLTIISTWQLTKSTISTQTNIVHVCKPHPMNSIAGLTARFLRGNQLFLDCDDYEGSSGHFKAKWQKMFIVFFEKHVPHHVKMVTTNTFFMHQKLLSWGVPPEKIFYLSNGVDRNRFKPADSDLVNELRSTFGLEGKPVVSFIGSMSLTNHAVDLLIEAFGYIQDVLPKAVLLLVGGGEDLPKLRNQVEVKGIKNSVIFCGRVSPEKVSLYYQLACVSVDPVYDNDASRGRCPLKLFESWACGVPFVSGDVGDRRMLLGSPPAGLLAKAGDPNSLATEIIRVLTNPDLSNSLIQRGFENVESYYWDVLAKKLEKIYLDFN